ncbi:MAG: hypothetical protein ACRD1S_18960 [Vicinamibacterales bacterium]
MTQKFGWALRALAVSAAAVGLLGRPVAGQSLAEIAKKEEERRKTAKSNAPAKAGKDKNQKTFTNKDLVPPDPGSAPPSPAAPPAQEGQPPGQPPATAAKPEPPAQPRTPVEPKSDVQDEKNWRGRMAAARAELQREELFLEALQSRVNALTTDFVNRDDPAQRATIAANRQKALGEMETVRKEIERAKKQIADIEEEARKAGVPPGWLR